MGYCSPAIAVHAGMKRFKQPSKLRKISFVGYCSPAIGTRKDAT